MTAEIAILNKTAVALAADSAVTISAGRREQKIFDSEDKLFELSAHNPIGIMINNNMGFMEAPLPALIKQFRSLCTPAKKVSDAAKEFLHFLDEFGKAAPPAVAERAILSIIEPIAESISKRCFEKFQEMVEGDNPPDDVKVALAEIVKNTVESYERYFQKQVDAKFVGNGPLEVPADKETLIRSVVDENLPIADEEQKGRVVEICKLALRKRVLSRGCTGVVIAGFGDKDLFPKLLSYEIDGMVCGRLKFVETHAVDIDRKGPKARVLPFAQKEMVERFLYGLDENIERQVTLFCKETIPKIRGEIVGRLQFDSEQSKSSLEQNAKSAEDAFIEGLKSRAFEKIRNQSRAEIEDMVEFMPKPELATMAEALVNLTSIKRRVTRGMETVGGPIDVAVISQAEGFVWIKRKHYFPQDLNIRYLERVRQAAATNHEVRNGTVRPKSRRSSAARGGKGKEAEGGDA